LSKPALSHQQQTTMLTAQLNRNRARKDGPKRLYQSYATPASLASWKMRPFFRADTLEVVRQAILGGNTNDYQGRLFLADGFVHQLSFPEKADKANGTTALVGSISDKLDHPSIVEIPFASANQWFVSLVPAPEGANPGTDIIYASANNPSPDQVGPPAPAAAGAAEGGEAAAAVAPSNARLHYEGAEPDLRFGVLPLMPPVPCGINIPTQHRVHEPFPPEVVAAAPFLEVWRLAASWTISNNDGRSVNHGGPMFNQPDLTFTPPDLLLNFDTTVNPIQIEYEMVRPTAELHVQATTTILPATDSAWDRIAALLPATDNGVASAQPAYPATPAPVTPGEGTHLLASVLDRYVNSKTPEERETADQTKKTMSIFSLLTASVESVPIRHVSPGTLSSSFLHVLETKQKEAARETLAEGVFEKKHAMLAADHRLSLLTSITPDMFDQPLTVHIKAGSLYTTKFMPGDLPKGRVSILCFLSPTAETAERSKADNETASHAAVGNDTKKITANHELFTGGKLHGILDVKCLLANILTFLAYICDNAEHSALYNSLNAFLTIISTHENSQLLRARKEQAKVAHNLATYIQDIFGAYAKVAKTPGLVLAHKEHRDIDAAPLQQAVNLANKILDHVTTSINMSASTFEAESVLWTLLQKSKGGQSGPQLASPASKPNSARVSYPATPPATGKRAADGSKKSPAVDLAASRRAGFLVPADDNLDTKVVRDLAGQCPAFMTTPSGSKERLCLRHCLKGWACGYGQRCHSPHPDSFESIDPTNQEKLAEWVKNTPSIKFLPGQGPRGTP
jgi:hypothetical protein